jgi:acetyltransferase-like isoleucine patch superfamily enzyme
MGALSQWLSRRTVLRRAALGRDVVLRGTIWMRGDGTVRIGDGVVLDGSVAPIELHVHEGGELVLDAGVRIDGGTSIEARKHVHLGARVRVGAFCKILDNHYHRPSGAHRRDLPASSPVEVEDDVTLGARVLLLPGAYLGRGCVVGPGTVVTRRVPAFSHVVGFPATVRGMS